MDTLRDWLAEHPPPDERFTQTLTGVAARAQAGEDLRFAVRELLDEFALRGRDDLRAQALAEEPASVDPHVDAYLGALAEHLARTHALPVPAWAQSAERVLDHMWFPGVAPGFRPTALRESPAAFRRRGIFIARGALTRV
ncbi:MAG TPA: hypothetical protein VFF79_02635 [Conexibacter sp.]|jgi:hypothetical protein|nr:hypothetical protein [Conexibacter sp.]